MPSALTDEETASFNRNSEHNRRRVERLAREDAARQAALAAAEAEAAKAKR